MPQQSSRLNGQIQQLQQLLVQMQQAVDAAKWLQVQAFDRQITALVQQLSQHGSDVRIKTELEALKLNYQHMIQQAKQQQLELEQKMKEFNDNKAGVLAYQQTTQSRS
ncbi:hypothetical protein [Rheinheimera sp.]|uniref:hypothetical protein n=1 Tax=Rheinheimera sp. TaxID=1869214 RepID=UPI0027BA1B60|nr:hypothetical protein [Rheinheimera sp.]